MGSRDRPQEGGLCENLPDSSPQWRWAATPTDTLHGGEAGEGLSRPPETPAELMVGFVIFVDYIC